MRINFVSLSVTLHVSLIIVYNYLIIPLSLVERIMIDIHILTLKGEMQLSNSKQTQTLTIRT